MAQVILIMILFTGSPDAPKIDIRRVPVSLEECWSWIRAVEPAPPGRRAYCAKVHVEWIINPNRNCWYQNCGVVPG